VRIVRESYQPAELTFSLDHFDGNLIETLGRYPDLT
jgi:hypothetical protein